MRLSLICLFYCFFSLVSFFLEPAFSEQRGNFYYPNGQVLTSNCLEVEKLSRKQTYNKEKAAWCLGFMASIMDAQNYFVAMQAQKGKQQGASDSMRSDSVNGEALKAYRFFCAPSKLTTVAATQVILDFVQKNTDKVGYPAAYLSYTALSQKFPCQAAN